MSRNLESKRQNHRRKKGIINPEISKKVRKIQKSRQKESGQPIIYRLFVVKRDHAQNTTNSAIALVDYNVVPILIGPPAWTPITSIMYHVGERTRRYPFPVTGNGHGWVPSPMWHTVEVIGTHAGGPIRRGVTLLTTNEIAGLVVFWASSLMVASQIIK